MFATGPVAIVLPTMGIGGRLWNIIMDINKPQRSTSFDSHKRLQQKKTPRVGRSFWIKKYSDNKCMLN